MINKKVEQLIQSWKNLDIRNESDIHPSGMVEMDQNESEGVAGGLKPVPTKNSYDGQPHTCDA